MPMPAVSLNESLTRLFRPRNVAVIGASRTPGRQGNTALRHMIKGGFAGGIFPVNPSGEKIEGRLDRLDDFIVTLTSADGIQRSFRRRGDVPRVQIRNPMATHIRLLSEYSDTDIPNVTAYLVTLK